MGGGDAVWAIPATATASPGGVEAGGGGWTEAGGGTGGGRVQAMMQCGPFQQPPLHHLEAWRLAAEDGRRLAAALEEGGCRR